MGLEWEHCGRCGTLVDAFFGREAATSNSSYCAKCTEELRREYLARSICSVCAQPIAKGDVRFLMPSRLYSNYILDRLPIENRLACLRCYKEIARLNLTKGPFVKLGHIRAKVLRNTARKHAIEMMVLS